MFRILPLLLPLLLVACAGEPSPESVARGYTEALWQKDWSRACSVVEEESLQRLEEIEARSCEESLRERWRDKPRQDAPQREWNLSREGEWAWGSTGELGTIWLRQNNGSWEVSWLGG